jgi:NAD(P)-dependent dehydrogenase (short-subunit alcohol dehydrogenase family)
MVMRDWDFDTVQFLTERFALTDRVVVVTGASRGIGAAVASGLARAGAQVHGLSRSNNGPTEIKHYGCDLADTGQIDEVIAEIGTRAGHIDSLINAAGVSLPPADRDGRHELERFNRTLAIDLTSAYACILAVLPFLRQAGGGAILNITSINSIRGFPGNPGYVAAKAGLAGLTRALAVDLAPDRVRVNALAPGYVHTQMTSSSYDDPVLHEQRRCHTALGRWGSVDDMIGAALFLVSPASSYVTGQELFVDGGWTVNGLVTR